MIYEMDEIDQNSKLKTILKNQAKRMTYESIAKEYK